MPKIKKVAIKATEKAPAAIKGPKPKFMMIGKGKFVHVVRTKAWDLKHSECQQVRRATVADKFNYKSKGLSAEAALALDMCVDCGAEDIARLIVREAETPEQRKAKSNDKRNEVLERAAGKKAKVTARVDKKPRQEPKQEKSKPAAEPKKPSMTKSGPRSTASAKDGDPSKAKAQLLADHGTEHGWATRIEKDDQGWVVWAERGNETIWAPFVDGKFDETRYGTLTVGNWTGKLRAAHACRRQMHGEGRDKPFPEPGKGRTGARSPKAEVVPEDESPEDAARRVPFLLDDDDLTVLDAIKGKTIRWRNGKSNHIEEGWVPSQSKRTVLKAHPKSPEVPGARILSFFVVDSIVEGREQYGGERNVRLDKIIRVVG